MEKDYQVEVLDPLQLAPRHHLAGQVVDMALVQALKEPAQGTPTTPSGGNGQSPTAPQPRASQAVTELHPPSRSQADQLAQALLEGAGPEAAKRRRRRLAWSRSVGQALQPRAARVGVKRHATRPGGYYGAIIGDVRRKGEYFSYQADLITRLPKAELKAVLIKVQHNAASNATTYPLSLPRIMHEYIVLWRKRHHMTVAGPQPPPAEPGV